MIKDINAITPEYMKHRLEEETEQYKQEIERLNNIINKAIKYCKESNVTMKSYYFIDLLKLLEGDSK